MVEEMVLKISLFIDTNFWSTGCINVNFHSRELEIEFLCFGIYFRREKKLTKIK